MNSRTIHFDSYGDFYRAVAEEISDAELRERGMSAHEVLRVRRLSDFERCEAITAFLVRDSLSGLRSRR